ncbi:MAG: ABC transporter permease [Desulfobacteraceae bacterium]|nr:ABC transporter permease [Desulfobacteraceae bacterium]
MNRYVRRALVDIKLNKFLNLITIITIALSILVVSTFMLFFQNISNMVETWNRGGRVMVYLDDSFTSDMIPEINAKLKALDNTKQVFFISKDVALNNLKKDLNSDSIFFETLSENPLPDAFDVRMSGVSNFEDVTLFAEKIKTIPMVTEVEYGKSWLEKFLSIYSLFKVAGWAISSLFFLIALFITANTVRLAFFSRKEEIGIMHLVGATDRFIKTPFYLEGVFQGAIGGITGLIVLLISYLSLSSGVNDAVASYMFVDIQFLSFKYILIIISGSTFLGWFGCYISLKQLLK